MAANLNPSPSWTPAACDWLVAQMVHHALPALVAELRLLNKWRSKVDCLLDEKSLNASQRAELTYILDQLARCQLIYAGQEDGPTRGEQ